MEQSHPEADFTSLEMAPSERAEALKILGKRQRRVGKIEECAVDLYSLFERQKRFCPSMIEGELTETTTDGADMRLGIGE